MTISRKFFAANVDLPANQATSLYTLMKNSALHWGYEDAALTTPSMDSITGSNAFFTPSGGVYVGSDSNVRNAALGGATYRGALAPGGERYPLSDFGDAFGVIDPNTIYVYAQSGAQLDLTFTGR